MPIANGSQDHAVPLKARAYAQPMASTMTARSTTALPKGPASQPTTRPAPPATTAIVAAAERETRPAGIGLPGFAAPSAGASTMSFRVPIEAWSAVIDTPSAIAVPVSAPAISATAATTMPSSKDGKGCDSRTNPATTAAGPPDRAGSSDVDDLVEVLDEVFDQPISSIGDLRPDPGHQGVERDGRDDQPALRVAPDHCRRPAARSEHSFETTLVQACRTTEVVDDLDDAATDHDVAHELCRPRVDLLVALVGEAGAILGRIGGQAGRSHGSSCVSRATEVCQTAPPRRGRRERPARPPPA